jgi:hypothetical protein
VPCAHSSGFVVKTFQDLWEFLGEIMPLSFGILKLKAAMAGRMREDQTLSP